MFEATKNRLVELKASPERVAIAAAPRIQAKFRRDATTKRGNVPSYGKMGNVPIVAKARPEAIVVTAPDWCVEKAAELGQIDEWVGIVTQESARILGGGK